MDIESFIEEDLKIMPGVGATKSVGSDCYPFYVSEVLPNHVIGMYEPKSHFDKDHPWEGGTMVVDAFNPQHRSELYIKRRYGKWWKCTKEGKPVGRLTCRYIRLEFGNAYSYQNPSF